MSLQFGHSSISGSRSRWVWMTPCSKRSGWERLGGWLVWQMHCPVSPWSCSTLEIRGQDRKAFELYGWFLPLLRMDTVLKFVQLIKLVQVELGMGNTRVRPPRLELVGSELEQVKRVIGEALRTRSESVSSSMAASTPPLSGEGVVRLTRENGTDAKNCFSNAEPQSALKCAQSSREVRNVKCRKTVLAG